MSFHSPQSDGSWNPETRSLAPGDVIDQLLLVQSFELSCPRTQVWSTAFTTGTTTTMAATENSFRSRAGAAQLLDMFQIHIGQVDFCRSEAEARAKPTAGPKRRHGALSSASRCCVVALVTASRRFGTPQIGSRLWTVEQWRLW